VCSGEACLLCGEKCLKFESPVLVCHGSCGQRIKKNSVFFVSADASDIYCPRCYGNLPSVIYDTPERRLCKRDMLKRKVDEEVWEPWINCDECGSWMHKVCALVNDRVGEAAMRALEYRCPLCRLEDARSLSSQASTDPRPEDSDLRSCQTDSPSDIDSDVGSVVAREDELLPNLKSSELLSGGTDYWRATTLPKTRLSDFLEVMLAERLAKTGFPDLMESLTVRVASNVSDLLYLPPPILNNFVSSEGCLLERALPYRQKSILLFQRMDGVDVCLFSLYVQEFDASCPAPNKSKVYIAYLDSVEYFSPREARTLVYHEVMAAYLRWAQARGFESAHIWACPPQRGDNFIFWSHPTFQRTPSRDRLNNWYLLMLRRCEHLGITSDISNLWSSHFSQQSKKYKADSMRPRGPSCSDLTAAVSTVFEQPVCPAVFEGDFWVLECLRLHRYALSRSLGPTEDKDKGLAVRVARDLLKELLSAPAASIFNSPVDPVALNIPAYSDIVKRPMDLGTVRSNLRQSAYPSLLEFSQVTSSVFGLAHYRLTLFYLYTPAGRRLNLQQRDAV
jgi:hypothetical protein